MKHIRIVPPWLKRLLTTPTAELTRWQFAVRYFLELCRHGARQLRDHRATQMAAALAFRTIFGLIPVFVIATLLFRAYGGASLVSDFTDRMLSAAHLTDVASPQEGITLGEWARNAIHHINTNLSARTIGVVGALVLAWAAMGLLTTIERCFNTICQAQQHRSLHRRVPLYWMTATIGPALLYFSFVFQSRLVRWVKTADVGGSLADVAGVVVAFAATWLFLLALYELLPHTQVKLGAAIAGSLVAAVFWTIATHGFNTYVGWSFHREGSVFTLLYGTLGLIPLFMFWIYILWLIVLYGLELTSLLQFVGNRLDGTMPHRPDLPPLTDPASIVPVAQVVADRFARGLATSRDAVVEETQLPERAIELMLEALAKDGILHRVEADAEQAFTLSRPPDSISTAELLRIAQELSRSEHASCGSAWSWVQRLHDAQLELSVHKTLVELWRDRSENPHATAG